jgi:hypothetical protein
MSSNAKCIALFETANIALQIQSEQIEDVMNYVVIQFTANENHDFVARLFETFDVFECFDYCANLVTNTNIDTLISSISDIQRIALNLSDANALNISESDSQTLFALIESLDMHLHNCYSRDIANSDKVANHATKEKRAKMN